MDPRSNLWFAEDEGWMAGLVSRVRNSYIETMKQAVYLDYNATSPLHPVAREAMGVWMGVSANPSSIHRFGREARAAVEATRGLLAERLGADPANVIFTGSGTEANNQALRTCGADAFFVSAVEHASVMATAQALGACHLLPVTAEGVVTPEALEAALVAHPAERPMVSVMLANNETGVVQPVAALADVARRYGAMVHCDAVQGLGKLAVTLADLGVDMLTVSAHKAGGPVGVGALVLGACAPVAPLLTGGGQEKNRRAGTENVMALAGWGALLQIEDELLAHAETLRAWRDAMEARIRAEAPKAMVIGQGERLPNTSCLAMPGVENATQLMHFDLAGFAVSSGSACTSGKVGRSHVLSAMGLGEVAQHTLRVSLGWATTEADVLAFTEAWLKLYQRLAAKEAA